MLGCAILWLLLLWSPSRGQGCLDSMDSMLVLSGEPVSLRPPNTHTEVFGAEWKMRLSSRSETFVILTWKKTSGLKYTPLARKHFNHTLDFKGADLTLVIKVAKPQDSGLYWLEVTKESGEVCKAEFNVSILGHVGKPHLQGQGQALDGGLCQVALSCSVSGDGHVSYAWYRGRALIQTARNHTYQEVQAGGPHVYTCQVSNPVSGANHTLNLTDECRPATLSSRSLPFLVAITILVLLFFSTLTFFCVWKRKRLQIETSPKDFLTIYEDIKDLRSRRDEDQKLTGQERTVYSMIPLQSPDSASREVANTLYSSIQPSRKSGSKKRNHNSPLVCTIYKEVGKKQYKAHNPARLSHRELETFDVYS